MIFQFVQDEDRATICRTIEDSSNQSFDSTSTPLGDRVNERLKKRTLVFSDTSREVIHFLLSDRDYDGMYA